VRDETVRTIVARDGEPIPMVRTGAPPELPVRQRMLECPYCGSEFFLAEFADGRLDLIPYRRVIL
jgi:hypothetical protein